MRRYQKWLTVGLLALTTPGMVFAGPGSTKKAPTARAQSTTGKSSKQSANQELANRVRQSLEALAAGTKRAPIIFVAKPAMPRASAGSSYSSEGRPSHLKRTPSGAPGHSANICEIIRQSCRSSAVAIRPAVTQTVTPSQSIDNIETPVRRNLSHMAQGGIGWKKPNLQRGLL